MTQKIIYGTVSEDGKKQSGQGFEVQSVDTGTYAITFNEPFLEPPSVVATLKDWGIGDKLRKRGNCQGWYLDRSKIVRNSI